MGDVRDSQRGEVIHDCDTPYKRGTHARSGGLRLNACWRVAPSVRLSFRAITLRLAGRLSTASCRPSIPPVSGGRYEEVLMAHLKGRSLP